MKLPEVKRLMRENKIKGIGYLNKPEIIGKLIEHKVLPEDYIKPKNNEKIVDEKNNRLKNIRNNPRRVEITDKKTGEVTVFPSMHKVGRSIKQSSGLIYLYNGKTWRNRYEFRVLPTNSEQ